MNISDLLFEGSGIRYLVNPRSGMDKIIPGKNIPDLLHC
jgi:hypothetical protein